MVRLQIIYNVLTPPFLSCSALHQYNQKKIKTNHKIDSHEQLNAYITSVVTIFLQSLLFPMHFVQQYTLLQPEDLWHFPVRSNISGAVNINVIYVNLGLTNNILSSSWAAFNRLVVSGTILSDSCNSSS